MILTSGDLFSGERALINAYRFLFIQDNYIKRSWRCRCNDSSNSRKHYVQKLKYHSKKQLKWMLINFDDVIQDFPRLTLEKLNSVALELYQLKQAR